MNMTSQALQISEFRHGFLLLESYCVVYKSYKIYSTLPTLVYSSQLSLLQNSVFIKLLTNWGDFKRDSKLLKAVEKILLIFKSKNILLIAFTNYLNLCIFIIKWILLLKIKWHTNYPRQFREP